MKDGIPFKILLVDDDEDDRILIDEAFLEIGYDSEVKKFIDGKGLLRYLNQVDAAQYPSLIVLDNSLPEQDAGDLLSILKNNSSYKHIPVIVYTTLLTPSKREQLFNKGAYTCLEKGNTIQDIIEVAKELRNMAQNNSETFH